MYRLQICGYMSGVYSKIKPKILDAIDIVEGFKDPLRGYPIRKDLGRDKDEGYIQYSHAEDSTDLVFPNRSCVLADYYWDSSTRENQGWGDIRLNLKRISMRDPEPLIRSTSFTLTSGHNARIVRGYVAIHRFDRCVDGYLLHYLMTMSNELRNLYA